MTIRFIAPPETVNNRKAIKCRNIMKKNLRKIRTSQVYLRDIISRFFFKFLDRF